MSSGILPPFFIFLHVKNKVKKTPVKKFNVNLTGGLPLLQALRYLEDNNNEFDFQTKNFHSSSSQYVVEVMGQSSGPKQFWETLLWSPLNQDVIPISLDYIVGMGDEVFLEFTDFSAAE